MSEEPKTENLKRDHWTNDEILYLVAGCGIKPRAEISEAETEWYAGHKAAIDSVREMFGNFKADPEKSFSATAYDTSTKGIWNVSAHRLPR